MKRGKKKNIMKKCNNKKKEQHILLFLNHISHMHFPKEEEKKTNMGL